MPLCPIKVNTSAATINIKYKTNSGKSIKKAKCEFKDLKIIKKFQKHSQVKKLLCVMEIIVCKLTHWIAQVVEFAQQCAQLKL